MYYQTVRLADTYCILQLTYWSAYCRTGRTYMYTYHAKSINNTRKNIIRNFVKCELMTLVLLMDFA